MKASRATLLLGVLGATSASASHTKSPVEQVVNLLKDLKSNIEKDREEEKKAYDKFSCWCTSTANRKAKAIHQARDDLNELGKEIMGLKAKTKKLATEIDENLSDIKDNRQEQFEATETREEENKSWMATSAGAETTMNDLGKTLNVLAASSLVQKNGGKEAEESAERALAAVQETISNLPDAVMMNLSPKTLSMLQQTKFKPAHDTLETILKAVDKEVTEDFEARKDEEKALDEDYEDLMASKQKEMKTLEDGIRKKEKEKAEAEIELAAAVQEYDDTDSQMNGDIEFFDEAKESCTDKSEEWTEREDLRTAELDGIKEALKILTSDEAREMFAKAVKPGFETFIQVDASESNPVLAATEKAYSVVKALSGKADDKKAVEFARLAVSIKESASAMKKKGKGARDQFGAVLAEIDKIIGNLKDEGQADIDKRDECKEQYQSIALEIQERNWKVEKNEAKISKLEDMIKTKQEEKAKTIEEIEAVTKEIEELEDQRKADAEAFEQAKSDDEAAIDLLHSARDALKKFYEDNDIDMGELQEPALLAVGKKAREPEFERDEDDAPDAKFSEKGNSKNQAKGILSLLAMISEDLEDEVKNAIKAEDKAIEAYDKQLKVTKDTKKDLIEKKTNIQSVIDKHDTAKTNEEDDMADNKDAIESEKTYKADIQVDCDFILKAFDYRRERRAMEIDALQKAKAMLRGAAPSAFLEKKVPVKPH